MSYQKLTRDQIAQRVAQDIPDGAYVNLGIGVPTRIAKYLPKDKEIFLHSENGLLAFGPPPATGKEDADLINAGKEFVTMLTGGCYFHHGDSFAMMRGGHLDICVLGAFQIAQNGDLANWHTGTSDAIPAVGGAMDLAVGAFQIAQNGDLANWHTGTSDAIPAVGGAMDLAVGAKKVYVTTEHTTKTGAAKIVKTLTYPITGQKCVDRIYTNLCVIEVQTSGLEVIEMVEGLTFDQLQQLTDAPLINKTHPILD